MKRALTVILSVLILFCAMTGTGCAEAPATADEAVQAMMQNITGEELSALDEMRSDKSVTFEQKVVYDEGTNTFTHYVLYPAFFIPGYVMTMDMEADKKEAWSQLWTKCREYAELWLIADMADAAGFPGATIVMKFVTTVDTTAENFVEFYSLSIKDSTVTILVNMFTNDYEPALVK